MKQTDNIKPELTDAEKIAKLGGYCAALIECVKTVITGCRNGHIKSKPFMETDPEATEYRMLSLEEVCWEALGKCGIKEQKEPTAQ